MHGEPGEWAAATVRTRPQEHAFRRLVAAAISVILVVAVAVTLRSSSASGWRSVDADELLAAPAKQLKAQHTRGVEPVRPHVFDSSDEQTSLSHTSAEAQKKETAFDHHVEALRAQSKKNTLHHEHEVNAEEVATEKKFINLIPHRPAVFNSQSEAAQEHAAAVSAQQSETKLRGEESMYAKRSEQHEQSHEEKLDAQILRAQKKEATLLHRNNVGRGTVYTSKQAEETQAEGERTAERSEAAWKQRVAMYRQEAQASTAAFQSTLHQLAAKSHAREESDASAKGHGTHVFSSGDAGRAEEDAAAKEREREREFREVVKKIGKKEGKEEVEKREERAKRQGEEAKRQAVALRMQRPDTPVLEEAARRHAQSVKEALGEVEGREQRFESTVKREEAREQEVHAAQAKAVADARAQAREEESEQERRDKTAKEREAEAMKEETSELQRKEAEGGDPLGVEQWPSAAS